MTKGIETKMKKKKVVKLSAAARGIKKDTPKKKKRAAKKPRVVEAQPGTVMVMRKLTVEKNQKVEIKDAGGKLEIQEVEVKKGGQLITFGSASKNVSLGRLQIEEGGSVINKY